MATFDDQVRKVIGGLIEKSEHQQKDIANACGWVRDKVWRIYHGKCKLTLNDLHSLCSVLEVSVIQVISDAEALGDVEKPKLIESAKLKPGPKPKPKPKREHKTTKGQIAVKALTENDVLLGGWTKEERAKGFMTGQQLAEKIGVCERTIGLAKKAMRLAPHLIDDMINGDLIPEKVVNEYSEPIQPKVETVKPEPETEPIRPKLEPVKPEPEV